MAAIEDGTSNTLMFSESCINDGTNNDRSVLSGVARVNSTPLIPKTCSEYQGSNGQLNLPSGITVWGAYKGMRWGDGRNSLFQAVLSPNAPTCFFSNEENQMMLTVSSYHTGGVNATLCDGAVRFISSTINTGDIDIETPLDYMGSSNYGVWGAMGSINGSESSSP
jgi:prepilin-type processing-associated H-X9-DG protein